MVLVCYQHLNDVTNLLDFYCELNDVVVGLGLIFLFLVLIVIFKKIIWT